MARFTGILFLIAGGILPAAETQSLTVTRFLEALQAGKTSLEENPEVVVSPFCPGEKKQQFGDGLSALGRELRDVTTSAEEVVAPRESFSGYRLVLRQKANPMKVVVRPLCLLRTESGWKVAAGLNHFENTNFGFDPKLRQVAREVAEATCRDAEKTGTQLLSQGAESLWKQIRDRRASWPDDANDPEAHIRRFLEYDRQRDAIGQLACFHVTPDLPPDNLHQFLQALADSSFGTTLEEEARHGKVQEDEPGTEPTPIPAGADLNFPISIFLESKAEGEKLCRAYGFLHPEEPSNFYTQAFYLRKGEGNRWLIIPDGYEIEGLRKPDSDLEEWYNENEARLANLLVLKLAEDARKAKPVPAEREDGAAVAARYLDALGRRAIPEVLSMLDLPNNDLVDDYDGMMEEMGQECSRFSPAKSKPPVIIPMRWKAEGDFGGAVHAIYQPAATRPFVLHSMLMHWTPEGWRALPPAWDGAPEPLAHRPEARKIQTMLEEGWDAQKQEAVAKIFGNPAGVPEAGRDPALAVKDVIEKSFAAAIAGDYPAYLNLWESPVKRPDPVAALEMATRLGSEIQKRESMPSPDPEDIEVRGNLAGVLLPVEQAKREDGQTPARMVLVRRVNQSWFLVPGVELFRPINRGFKALNNQSIKALKDVIEADGQKDLEGLHTWLEQLPAKP